MNIQKSSSNSTNRIQPPVYPTTGNAGETNQAQAGALTQKAGDSFKSLAEAGSQLFRNLFQPSGQSSVQDGAAQLPAGRPHLQKGASGPAVAQLQTLLQKTGHSPGGADGQFGPKTREAVKDFQRANGLKPDGVVGPKTWSAMEKALGSPRQPAGPQQPTGPQGPVGPNNLVPTGPTGPIAPTPATGPVQERLTQTLANSAASAHNEWQAGVREQPPGSNRSPRIDEYAKNGGFSPSKAPAWCGLFTAHNYSQNGFKHASSLASQQKARDFFMYRNYTKKTNDPAQGKLDALRTEQQAQGSQREYFMLPESPDRKMIQNNPKRYGHIDLEKNTFNFDQLPIKPGDTALFAHGHVGMVSSYDPASGKLTTIEGNTSGMGPDGKHRNQAVVQKSYDLSDPAVRAKFSGFGRPAMGDFE